MTEHVRTDHESGDGYTEPYALWTTCSCGLVVWAWDQTAPYPHDDPEDNPNAAWVRHLRAEAANSLRALIIETIKHRALTSWERTAYARSLLAAAIGRSVFLCDDEETT